MMNQVKNKLIIIILSLVVLTQLSCGTAKLKSVQEAPVENYLTEAEKIQKQINENLVVSGKIKAREMGLSTVYIKVIFQRFSTLAPEDKNFIDYQTWWNTKEGLWGFTGVAQKVYEKISDKIEDEFGRVIGVNQNMFIGLNTASKQITYPVKVPTGGIERKEDFKKYLELATVTSYNYGAFHASQGRSIAQAAVEKDGALFLPYFNIFLNKDLATIGKIDGELVINYKAFINGYFQLCNHKKCEQATLPKGQHLTVTVPLPPKVALFSSKQQEAINMLAQKHLGQIMTDFAMSALAQLKE